MNFDLNDPLGDILSDDSNDSFFNNDKYKTNINKVSIEQKKSNIFGLNTEPSQNLEVNPEKEEIKVKSQSSNHDWLGLLPSPTFEKKNITESNQFNTGKEIAKQTDLKPSTEGVKNVTITRKISNKLDFLDELDGIDSKLELSSNITLDEILKKPNNLKKNDPSIASPRKEIITKPFAGYNPTSNIKKDSLKLEKNNKFPRNIKDLNEKTNSNPILTNITTRRQKTNKDWLGLLSDNSDTILNVKEDSTLKKPLSDLLALSEDNNKVITKNIDNMVKIEQEHIEKPNIDDLNKLEFVNDGIGKSNTPDVYKSLDNLSDVNIEHQSAALFLKQQESHLKIALQLKAQEEKLIALHEQQVESKKIRHEFASAHKDQLNRIIKGQSEHRIQLHNIISQHQQRINKHIQLLLQPSSDYIAIDEKVNSENEGKIIINENAEMEQIIYKRETDILKRQIQFLNESLDVLEERFKNENENLSKFYLMKINKLEEDNIKIGQHFEDEIRIIHQKHKAELERIQNKHYENIEIIQKEHQRVVDNIRETIIHEQLTIKETTNYTDNLEKFLINASDIMKKVENINNDNINSQSEALQRRENQIERMLNNLEKRGTEMDENMNAFHILEDRLKQQMQSIEEEREILKQKQSSLTLENDKLKMEYNTLMKQLENEKEIFMKNAAYIEKTNNEVKADIAEKFKKIENETSAIANERKILNEMKSENKALKQKLEDELQELDVKKSTLEAEQKKYYQNEAHLLERSRELEDLTRSAINQKKNAENRILETNYIQKKYEEKFNNLREQALSLNVREQQITKDKVALSRERLLLYNQINENKCMLCNSYQANSLPQKFGNLKKDNILNEHGQTYSNFHIHNDLINTNGFQDPFEDIVNDTIDKTFKYKSNINEYQNEFSDADFDKIIQINN